ncbi:MAG: hypothetical protein HGB12_16960, partial [Bacteroidetes bacterium]|nr:hypothetical protein [Bacteroidota bacterium]
MKSYKTELILFYVLCFISILPILFTRYYVTLDGSSHIYNANLIKSLVFQSDLETMKLFQINSIAVPNWMGHFIMAFLRIFLPAFLSEKILLLLYFILTPLFFRKFILLFNPSGKIFTYFIFLFTHNVLLYLGFFNMMLGIMFLFISIFYYHKYCQIFNLKRFIILTLLLLIVYFSHIMIFAITVCFLAILSFYISDIHSNNTLRKKILNRLMLLFLSALPSLILAFKYFILVDSIDEGEPQLPFVKLLTEFINVQPLLTLSGNNPWKIYTNILFILFTIIIISRIIVLVKKVIMAKGSNLRPKFKIPSFKVVCLLTSFVFLILYFILPNGMMISIRLLLLFYLFFVMWIALNEYPKWIHVLTFT